MTKANLLRREITVESSTCMCGEDVEITSHLFSTCRVEWLVWSEYYVWVGRTTVVHQDPKLLFSHFRLNEESEDVNRIWYCVWVAVIGELWKQRNKKVFKN